MIRYKLPACKVAVIGAAVSNERFLFTGLVYRLNMIYVNYDGRHNGQHVHLPAK